MPKATPARTIGGPDRPAHEGAAVIGSGGARLTRTRLMCAGGGVVATVMMIAACGSDNGPAVNVTSPPPASASSAPVPTLHPTVPTARSIPDSEVKGATIPPVSICRAQQCRVARTADLPDGYELRLWSAAGGAARPMLQLVKTGQSVAWMVLPRGQAIGSALTCAGNAPVPHCVVVSPVGAHSAIAEMVLVPAGRLVDTGAFAVAATPTLVAVDLDHDEYLDVSARDSDYRPNFAEGHLFDRTYRYDPQLGRFHPTGCTPVLTTPARAAPPSTLQFGPCPAR